MICIFKKDKKLRITFIAFLIWTVLFPIWRNEMTKLPLDLPISISPPSHIDTKIYVPLSEPYHLWLEFDRENITIENAKKVFGDGERDKGVPIPVRWEVYSISSGECILSGEKQTLGAQSWSKDNVGRLIGYVTDGSKKVLDPGEYRFVAYVQQDVPQFSAYKARIKMALPVDGGFSWQCSVIFWGSIFEQLIWIVDFLLLAVVVRKHYGGDL